MNNKELVLSVDVENNPNPSAIPLIIRAAQSAGSLAKVLLFGNRNLPTLSRWKSPEITQILNKCGAIWSPVPTLRPGKNAADIALTYEIAQLTQSGTVNQVWIVSSDSDFTPLAERLLQKQIHVVVFGSKLTPLSLRTACSSFVLINDIQNEIRAGSGEKGSQGRAETFPQGQPGWLHGFVKTLKGTYGFIQANAPRPLFFCGSTVDAPLTIQGLRNGDQVQFKLGRNHKGVIAVHVRKMFALRPA